MKLTIVALVLIASLSGTVALLYNENQDLAVEVATQTSRADRAELVIKTQKVQQAKLERLNSDRVIELRKMEKYLESMKGREATLVAKPRLVEKLIQKSFKEREERLECITGGLCTK